MPPGSKCAEPSQGAKHLLFNWGDASGIEVSSTESRCEAPWIEMCSTEAFNLNWARIKVHSTESRCEVPWIEVCNIEAFNLNWGDAQTWLGQLLVNK